MPRKNKSEKIVHVRIESPITTRKNILGTALDAASMLKTYEDVMFLRRKKAKILDSLNNSFISINKMFKDLDKKYLPEIPVEEHVEHEDFNLEPSKVPEVGENTDSEVERLKRELADIDRKLKNL